MNGFSTPWTSMWTFSAHVPLKHSPHFSHLEQNKQVVSTKTVTVSLCWVDLFKRCCWYFMKVVDSCCQAHLHGFSPLCSLRCLCRLYLRPNLRPQVWHMKGFSPVCTTRCCKRPIRHLNALSHWLHLNGLSSECDLLWTRRLLAVEKVLPQVWQRYGRAPVWTVWCSRRLFFLVKLFEQTLHE